MCDTLFIICDPVSEKRSYQLSKYPYHNSWSSKANTLWLHPQLVHVSIPYLQVKLCIAKHVQS